MRTLTFQSTYDYSASASGIEIPVILRVGTDRTVRLLANVDTGSSFCIFQRDYAEQLGIEVENGLHQPITTAAGAFDAYGHHVMLSCLDWEFETTVYFAAPPNFPRNVVGRSGWLEHFRLAVIHHDSVLHLSHYDD